MCGHAGDLGRRDRHDRACDVAVAPARHIAACRRNRDLLLPGHQARQDLDRAIGERWRAAPRQSGGCCHGRSGCRPSVAPAPGRRRPCAPRRRRRSRHPSLSRSRGRPARGLFASGAIRASITCDGHATSCWSVSAVFVRLSSGKSSVGLSGYIRPFQGTRRRSRKRIKRSKAKAMMAITKMPMITTGVCRNWLADRTM